MFSARVHCRDAADFEAISPWSRGYVVGLRHDDAARSYAPDESNPFEPGTDNHTDWHAGHKLALRERQRLSSTPSLAR